LRVNASASPLLSFTRNSPADTRTVPNAPRSPARAWRRRRRHRREWRDPPTRAERSILPWPPSTGGHTSCTTNGVGGVACPVHQSTFRAPTRRILTWWPWRPADASRSAHGGVDACADRATCDRWMRTGPVSVQRGFGARWPARCHTQGAVTRVDPQARRLVTALRFQRFSLRVGSHSVSVGHPTRHVGGVHRV